MRISAAEIADKPPRGAIITRAAGRRAAGASAGGDRCITFIASDPSVGRDGHCILANAWQTENFERNPVFLFAHDDASPPVGRVILLRTVGDQLRATVRFAEADVYDFADTVYQLYVGGFLNACSTAWLPLKFEAANDRSRPGGLNFTSVELLEISGVPVPALPTALVTARGAGIDVAPFARWAERALDSRQTNLAEKELTMIRSAAGAARPYAAPRRSLLERLAERQRAHRPGADPASGFRSFGEFLQVVARASSPKTTDARLTRTPFPLGASESNPIAGGFTVPTTFIDRLVGSIYDDAVIAPLCEQIETENPSRAKMPGVDEKSRADGQRWGGATAYWVEEAESVTTTLAKWRAIEFVSNKLMAVCVATRELLEDAPMLDAYVHKAFGAELGFKLDAAILSGNGHGQPLGLLNGGGLITVPKANGQQSGSIISENVESMWARLPVPCRRRGVWLVNEDVENQLSAINPGGLNPTGAALYTAAGVADNETPLLKGRPLIVIEQAPALGTLGDIVLADLTQYAIVSAPVKADLSLDVEFVTDQGVFRFVWRIDGQPLWSSPIAPYNGTQTRSPYVTLAAR